MGEQADIAEAVAVLESIRELSTTGWQRYGSCGRHLIDLMRHSDAVLDAALRLAGPTETIAATSLAEGNS